MLDSASQFQVEWASLLVKGQRTGQCEWLLISSKTVALPVSSEPQVHGDGAAHRAGGATVAAGAAAERAADGVGGVGAGDGPVGGQELLEWLMVSSEGGPTAEWAERIVGWQEARWGI